MLNSLGFDLRYCTEPFVIVAEIPIDPDRNCTQTSRSFLSPGRIRDSPQDTLIEHDWIREIGLDDASYGKHTMRRTEASLIYRRTRNLRTVRLLFRHTKA